MVDMCLVSEWLKLLWFTVTSLRQTPSRQEWSLLLLTAASAKCCSGQIAAAKQMCTGGLMLQPLAHELNSTAGVHNTTCSS